MSCCSLKARAYTGSSSASTACDTDVPAGCRWADLADLSEDEDAIETSFTADAVTRPELGNPRRGALSSGPDTSEHGSWTPLLDPVTPENRQEGWRPNASAPEFIPTLTMACPLVGICCVIPEYAANLPGCFGPVLAMGTLPLVLPSSDNFGCAVKGASNTCSSKSTEAARPRKPGQARKPRPPALLTSNCRRTKCEPLQAGPPQGEMPEASEEEWQHRVEMRQKSVTLSKETAVYQWYSGLKLREEREVCEPMTPDPTDRTVSKRHWKYLVQRWRTAMYSLYLEDGNGSTQSADDWESMVTATTETGGATATTDPDDAASA